MTNPGYDANLDRALYSDADDVITPDRNGHEWFVKPQYTRRPLIASPLAADIPGADTANWSSDERPPVTAWEGADMDAHWLDKGTWRHCRTGEAWEGEPVNLLDALRAKIDADNAATNQMLAQIAVIHADTAAMQAVMFPVFDGEGSEHQMGVAAE